MQYCRHIFKNILDNTRVSFLASDANSGVHKIGIRLHVETPGKDMYTIYSNFTESMTAVSLNVIYNTLCHVTCKKA